MFEKEIEYIKSPIVKSLTKRGVNLIPEYFYRVPASSSGKYHPSYALGEGGLYRHVKVAVAVSQMLFTIKVYDFSDLSKDLIVSSLILHDGWKQGYDGSDGRTWHIHPLVASKVLRENIVPQDKFEEKCLASICSNIESHMGQWTTSPNDPTVLPEPYSDMEKFVHMCDYLASRKVLEYNFLAE